MRVNKFILHSQPDIRCYILIEKQRSQIVEDAGVRLFRKVFLFFWKPSYSFSDCFPKLSSFKRTQKRNTGTGNTGSGLPAQGGFTCHFLHKLQKNRILPKSENCRREKGSGINIANLCVQTGFA